MSFFTEADIAPEWGVVDRDGFLRTFWKQFGNDLLQGVLAASVAKIQTQNWELEGPEKLADFYHPVLRDEADFHRGYSYMVGRGVVDYYTQDNGWFMERRRASKKDLDGPMLGIAHLDSSRMRATGNADYPFTYNDVQGEYHLMHRSQFIRIVDMPTPETQMHGIEKGFCALSRALSTAIILTMLVAMKREKLADLPPSALAIFNNINRKQFTQAMTLWGAQDDMTGNVIWRQLLPLFGIDPAHPAGVQFISLREVWEGYDDMTAMNIAAYSFAAAWRMDPREFWPVSQGPLGTGREAEIQHEKAKAKSHGLLFTELERVFNADESLPRPIHFKFAMQDIEEEQQKAEIHAVQINNIKSMQEAGAQLSAPEVRHLLTTQYRVIPQIMAEVPVEGEEQDLSISDIHIDDVEREFKEFNWGPKVRLSDMGEKEYLADPVARAMLGLKSDKQYVHGPGGVFSSPGIEGGDEQKKCPKCGAKVKPDAKKCPECGAVLKQSAEKELSFGTKEVLISSVKEQFSCCPSHASQLFPNIVQDLLVLNYLTFDQSSKAGLLDENDVYTVSLASKEAYLRGEDVLEATAGAIGRVLQETSIMLGTKESKALVTIDKKIASLDKPTAQAVREGGRRLQDILSPTSRLKKLKDIPDEVWDEAVRADELDEQLTEEA